MNVSAKIKRYALNFFHLFARVMNHYGYDYLSLILCEYFDGYFVATAISDDVA